MSVIDSMTSGDIPIQSGDITELASSSISSADNTIVNVAFIVIIACWLVGIIDSYRLGLTREK